jgi:hypothetical protein
MIIRSRQGARILFSAAVAFSCVPLPAAAQSTQDATVTAPQDSLLRVELARADSMFFHALFVACDADEANALLTEDVEFYDDRTGLSAGSDLRADFRRLADDCPARNGVRRIPLAESIRVYPVPGYGAVRMGRHHFVEDGASTSTTARFVIVWRRVGAEWRIARVLSVDHQIVDATRAAKLRGG